MAYAPSPNWDLDSLYAGGPSGALITAEIESLDAELRELIDHGDTLGPRPAPAELAALLLALERIDDRLQQAHAFAGGWAAVRATDKAAIRAEARMGDLATLHARARVVPDDRVARCSDADFQALLARPELAHMRSLLQEKRRLARFRLPEAEEALARELARDGIMAWGELYDRESGALRIEVDRGHGPESLSAGQVSQLLSHEQAEIRERAFAAAVSGWRTLGDRCAAALTHITGTRIVLNDRRGLDPLDEPLAAARIERRTLEALFEAARSAGPLLHRYFRAKAKLLGKAALSWTDVLAPVGSGGGRVTYEDAQTFIVDQFSAFSPRLAEFSVRAFQHRWIEVEDRPGKRGGGYCAGVPLTRESRIFMTWGHNARSLSTLAHELGHAFHNEVLFALPPSQRELPMTLAETASTFGEALVRDAALRQATDPGVRLRLLDGALQDATAFLANIPARFDLELALYRMRREGPLDAEALERETTRTFSQWYGEGVSSVDPTFWSSKLHFYIPGVAFYNFPYLFGYLFSALVYEHFRPMGSEGAPGYERLLRRTGSEWAEPIARDELGVDLGDPETWKRALGGVERDLAQFEQLVQGE